MTVAKLDQVTRRKIARGAIVHTDAVDGRRDSAALMLRSKTTMRSPSWMGQMAEIERGRADNQPLIPKFQKSSA